MSNITSAHVNDMSKLIAAMNAAADAPESTPVTYQEISESIVVPSARPMTSDIAAMGKIMEAFNKAASDVVETAPVSMELSRALMTEATTKGARVGSWEIEVRDVAGFGKYYDIAHATTGEPIASDLRLYEAALAIVNYLNEGDTFTSPKIKAVVAFEDEYARNLVNAVGFASRMKITEGADHDIAAARYSQAKHKAVSAKNSLTAFIKHA